MKFLRTLFGFLLVTAAFAADVIPAARQASSLWAAAGVPGGIYQYRNRTVVNVTGLDNTGATDCAAAINAAIVAAANDTAVVLPAGTFRINSSVVIRRHRVTLRGQGPGLTTLMCYGNTGVSALGADAVAEVAAFGLGEFGPDPEHLPPAVFTDAGAALEAMATGHADPLCRESAVAALGALHSGRATVLAAMTDKATVRRRAVLALSPFDGAEVDAAIAAALSDRDWQVRQAAEDQVAARNSES